MACTGKVLIKIRSESRAWLKRACQYSLIYPHAKILTMHAMQVTHGAHVYTYLTHPLSILCQFILFCNVHFFVSLFIVFQRQNCCILFWAGMRWWWYMLAGIAYRHKRHSMKVSILKLQRDLSMFTFDDLPFYFIISISSSLTHLCLCQSTCRIYLEVPKQHLMMQVNSYGMSILDGVRFS